MITKKAAVGFIILALIVFPTAYISWEPADVIEDAAKVQFEDRLEQLDHLDKSVPVREYRYRAPLMTFESAFDMAVVSTAIIEMFTFICYLGLKRVEPAIKAWETEERERIREQNS
jgi:hypothetical protein